MKQYTENQYDDDLTVGTDDYDDSYYTGSVDLFEFSNDEESPISRLKSLILSIDWEITDDVLMQFNEELLDLRDIWAGEKINLVYVQALEKISKYIYQKKADSHPSAIKLLLTLYHNLEKIVSSVDLTDEQKKEILLEDVKRFESLKAHIGKQSQTVDVSRTDQQKPNIKTEKVERDSELLNLKAIVLGIDWEITDQDLNELRQEVVRLEEKFADSRPKLVLLQGIGTIGAYIKLKKSDSHADAFKILHLFYESLEKIVTTPMSIEEEKAILFPVVERFNSFKTLLGPTIASEETKRDEQGDDDVVEPGNSVDIAPAFSDLPEEEIKGFQAEEEARALGLESPGNVADHVENFFIDSTPEAPGLADDAGTVNSEISEVALQGVDVEVDDEEEGHNGLSSEWDTLAPALSTAIEEENEAEPSPTLQAEELSRPDEMLDPGESLEMPAEALSESLADFIDDEENSGHDFSQLDRDIVLQGVDVETEADDDSDEDALPMMEGELAPALADNDEVSIFNAEIFENSPELEVVDDEISGTLGGFFDEEIESHFSVGQEVQDVDSDVASIPVDLENELNETDFAEDSLPSVTSGPAIIEDQEGDGEFAIDDVASLATESVHSPAETPVAFEDEDEDDAIAFVSESDPEECLGLSFDRDSSGPGVEVRLEEDVVVENFDSGTLQEGESSSAIDEQLDSFFDLEEDFGESEDDTLLSSLSEEAVEKGVVPAVFDGSDEDEVVFELAEDDDLLSDAEPVVPEDVETIGDGVLSEADDMHFSENGAEAEEEVAESILATLGTYPTAGAFHALRICVESLGIELDDKVILGLWEEIDVLHQHLADKPLEKTFLQLLSTLTRHIDQNRYDSSSEAYVLLQSVCRAMTELQEDDLHQNQQMLLTETSNVLQWQEEVLAEQIVRNEAELTIGGPILSDQEDIGDFDELVQNSEEDQAVAAYASDDLPDLMASLNTIADETYDGDFDQSELEEPAQLNAAQEKASAGEDTLILSDDLKQEISTLRQSLQDEIAELRNDLKSNPS